MKQKILGLDLGTNSIGISIRNTQISGTVDQQLEYFSSIIFPSGVDTGNSREFSYAAQRTAYRSSRRLHQSRRYRIWRTLEVLINHGFCPLSMDELDQWRTYDKATGRKRQYPIEAHQFEQWVRLDFDCDGIPEYSSPHQLRAELMERQFDFNDTTERYKLGRALYHIAQHRGFKSSKGELLKDQESISNGEEYEISDQLKKSEEKLAKGLVEYMEQNDCPTVGCAYYHMEKNGIRVRGNKELQAVRAQYKQEIEAIFEYQSGLDSASEFYNQIISHKKGEGSIFYKRSLRPQKGMVGKCTLEKNKSRCPISRPEFEQFRAWSLINNLRYKTADDIGKASRELPLVLRTQLYNKHFVRVSNFKMSDVLKWLQQMDESIKELNYNGQTTVMGSPICARLRNLLGEDWLNAELEGYNYEELWHVCFEADKEDDTENTYVKEFAKNHLHADEQTTNRLVALSGNITTDYASLSLKAIRNILRMLQEGYIYSDAVLLAKLPDIFGANWDKVKTAILNEYPCIKAHIEDNRLVSKVVNNLIADYKILEPEDQFGIQNADYTLDNSDWDAIKKMTIKTLSYKYWKQLSIDKQDALLQNIGEAYQEFFHSHKRDYVNSLHLDDALIQLIETNFMDYVQPNYVNKILEHRDILYHPSVVNIYNPSIRRTIVDGDIIRSVKLLDSPATNVFRNPVVMRVLHQLRNTLNELITQGIIDESDTSIVVETAREMNDANWRAAIQKYQEEREKENAKYRQELLQHMPESKITSTDIDKVRLWIEQDKKSIYTGEHIQPTQLLINGECEIEHTIPRSISFDDSLANKTICEKSFNGYKNNRFPSELPEYETILSRIQPWKDKIKNLESQIVNLRNKCKMAPKVTSKDSSTTKIKTKDDYIVDRHILEMKLAYWRDKVSRFTTTHEEWKDGFRNNQLNDTRIITKYAYHFLKTVFGEVTVQRGEMTANFRKALGVQSLEEKKNRDLHSHHAIDATILTLIPTNTKRDKLLELFYQKEELYKQSQHDKTLAPKIREAEEEYNKALKSCDIKGVENVVSYIENNIIIRHQSKDQTLTPARRRQRVRGKVVKDGQNVRWITGDSLRGSLHKETWYGAIAMPKLDKNESAVLGENGNIVPDTSNIKYVVRRQLKYKASKRDSGFKDWEDLEKTIVDKALYELMRNQHLGLDFKTACEKGIYMLDKDGNRINRIRHIRCYAKVTTPLSVKAQTYPSKHEHKQQYWAESGDLSYMVKYQSEDGKVTQFIPYSLYAISQNRKYGLEDIPQSILGKKQEHLNLTYALRSGMSVLLYQNHIDELKGMPNNELSKRLYIIAGFESDGRIRFVHHLSAKKDLGNGEKIEDWTQLPEKIRCGIRTIKCLIEGIDFDITINGIEFK